MAQMQGKSSVGTKRRDFNHPYTPYDIQETFMNTVYDVLERGDGNVGILESPTGTVSLGQDSDRRVLEQQLMLQRANL